MPQPLDSTVSHSSEPHTAQAGSGGCRSVPHEVQCWISSRCARAPSNQNALSWVIAGRGRGGRAGFVRRRQVLEDAEAHGGHRLAGVEERLHLVVRHRPHRHVGIGHGHVVEAGRDEAAGAQPGALGIRDRLNHRAHQQAIPHDQRAPVVLLAVGGHHRGQALVVEQAHHLLVGPAPLLGPLGPGLLDEQREAQAAHDPGLQHGRRGDQLVVARRRGPHRRRRRPGCGRPSPRPSAGSSAR